MPSGALTSVTLKFLPPHSPMLRPLTRSVPASYLTQLGRFTLRDEGRTIGIGKCLKLLDDDEAAAATAK